MSTIMMSVPVAATLVLIAVIGHVMAFFWCLAARHEWKLSRRTIYALPFRRDQISRELRNSLHLPMHAAILLVFLSLGFFADRSPLSFVCSLLLTATWAEIWHYASHRAFHLRALHWIHVEHHKSQVNSPFTAISFSLTEKLVFDLGLLGLLAAIDCFISLNFFGVAAWYVGYLVINSFAHANFELKSKHYLRFLGRVLTSTTYHSLHHARYTSNYGLGTRVLDRICGTEWEDYERVYERLFSGQGPLTRLRQKIDAPSVNPRVAPSLDTARLGKPFDVSREGSTP